MDAMERSSRRGGMPRPDTAPGNAFWDFSRTVYSAPGVAGECLAAQDDYGADVNILLFCAWIAHAHRIALTADDLTQIETTVTVWRETVIKPLRAARRALKGRSETAILALRDRIKADELGAEKLEQAMLFAFAEKQWPRQGSAACADTMSANLGLYLRARGCASERIASVLECITLAVKDLA